jgi:hypothetical protein
MTDKFPQVEQKSVVGAAGLENKRSFICTNPKTFEFLVELG